MSERLRRWGAAAITVALAGIVVVGVATVPPAAVDRANAIGERIRCPVCQGESIAASPSDYAADMMALIRQRIDQGWSDQQIVDGFVDTYGGSVLLDPPFRPGTLLLWLVPAGALIAGVLVAMRRRRRPPPPPEEPAVETRPQPREAAS